MWPFKKKYRPTFITAIVPKIYDFPEREKKAREIVQWLVSINAIDETPSDCVFYINNPGYAIRRGAKKLVKWRTKLPFGKSENGMEVIRKTESFSSSMYGPESIICPVCKEDIAPHHKLYQQMHRREVSTCPACDTDIPVNDYIFSSPWACSNLAFVFWNWKNFKPSFIKKFEEKLGCAVAVIESVLIEEEEEKPVSK